MHDLELTERKICDMGAYEYSEVVLSPTPDNLLETPSPETPQDFMLESPSPAVSDSPSLVEGSSYSSSHPAESGQQSTVYVLILLLIVLFIILIIFLRRHYN